MLIHLGESCVRAGRTICMKTCGRSGSEIAGALSLYSLSVQHIRVLLVYGWTEWQFSALHYFCTYANQRYLLVTRENRLLG